MPLTTAPIVRETPDTGRRLTRPTFATRMHVELAASLVPHETLPDTIAVRPHPDLAWRDWQDRRTVHVGGSASLLEHADARVQVEGPRCYLEVSPGSLAIRYTDPVRADRTRARIAAAAHAAADLEAAAMNRRLAAGLDPIEDREPSRGRAVTVWSRKSRSRMVARMATLDYAAAYDLVPDTHGLGMATLTYPDRWEHLAPDAATCAAHLRSFRKRYERKYGRAFLVWKREFQRRGAPHYHLGGLLPVHDPGFKEWLSTTWADVVGEPDPVEHSKHVGAGTRLDVAHGSVADDPRSFSTYFAKHGIYGAKDYQNHAPSLWTDAGGSVGRFWGYWNLTPLVVGVEVAPDVAEAIRRTARRWHRAKGETMPVRVWRKRRGTVVDPDTGEVTGAGWVLRRQNRRVTRLGQPAGFLLHENAPGLLEALSRAADMAVKPTRPTPRGRVGRPGLGPVGFFPPDKPGWYGA